MLLQEHRGLERENAGILLQRVPEGWVCFSLAFMYIYFLEVAIEHLESILTPCRMAN